MEYPIPIDAAGRTALIILALAYMRVEGAHRLRRLRACHPGPWGWLDAIGQLGVRRALRRWTLQATPWCVVAVVLVVALVWSAYDAWRLWGDFARDPFRTFLGCSLAVAAWGAWWGDPGRSSDASPDRHSDLRP
jgi:hypothetical protein